MRRVAALALLLVLPAALAGCGGSSSETATPDEVCTQLTNIAGTLKNLSTGIASGEASIDAISYTTNQLKQELVQLDAAMEDIQDPNADRLHDSFRQLQLAYSRLEPGTTPKEAKAELKQPVADVKASWTALVDSLSCLGG